MKATIRIGLTRHAEARLRERIPALAGYHRERIKQDLLRMLETGRPKPRRNGAPGSVYETVHEESGVKVGLVVSVQANGEVVVITCLTAAHTNANAASEPLKKLCVNRGRRARLKHVSPTVRERLRDGYRNANNDPDFQ